VVACTEVERWEGGWVYAGCANEEREAEKKGVQRKRGTVVECAKEERKRGRVCKGREVACTKREVGRVCK
jgi:hypothetical protein